MNPSNADLKKSRLNLTIAGSEEAIVMVEAGAQEVSEKTMVEALSFGHARSRSRRSAEGTGFPTESPETGVCAAGPGSGKLLGRLLRKIRLDLRDALTPRKHERLKVTKMSMLSRKSW